MVLVDGLPSVVLSNVVQLIHQKVPTTTAPMIEQLFELLYRNISRLDLAKRNDSDTYGATLSLWNSLYTYSGTAPYIKVFNPQVSKNGWKSSHTVIEIIVDDKPFLVDSIRNTLSRLGITPHLLINCPLRVVRNKKHQITQLANFDDSSIKSTSIETVFFIEIDQHDDPVILKKVEDELRAVIRDISLIVGDCDLMQSKLSQVVIALKNSQLPCSQAEKNDALEFLQWLLNNNFTPMGYKSYSLKSLVGDVALVAQHDTSLGFMKNTSKSNNRLLSELSETAREVALGSNPLILTKTNSRSCIHRSVDLDYIGIKRFDCEGNVIGEDRFIGLFGTAYTTNSALDIPIIKSKINSVCASSGFAKGTHAYRSLINILETFPRDEILQYDTKDLLLNVLGILQMHERDYSSIFIRRDAFNRFYSCMVYVPRERYSTTLRIETQNFLQESLGSDREVEFTTYFSESSHARTHYIVRVKSIKPDINLKQMGKNLNEIANSWDDKLNLALYSQKGEAHGRALCRKYINIPQSYKDDVLPGTAIVDIEKLEALSEDNNLEMLFYKPQEELLGSRVVKLKLFHHGEPIHLSDVVPILENFGLRVIGETPYMLETAENENYWVLDFSMLLTGKGVGSHIKTQALFQDAFAKVWQGVLEDDGFNRLILTAELSGREVAILRAIAKYEHQIGGTFSQSYIEDTFFNYPNIAKLVIALFTNKFDPKHKFSKQHHDKFVNQIEVELDKVTNLDDDRIIRRFVEILDAVLRTNYYQPCSNGGEKSYISFKLQPSKITDIPLPVPEFEIFVYSPEVEGVHLRGGKVARGGLRWSDRREDFRTEVLGLVKAQQVKNSIIVPVGAKGGFVCKKLPLNSSRQQMQETGQACYRMFIRGLLDITDNIIDGCIIPPENVVRLDDDDPYLVVAADKGTATFSDIANEISDQYNFWMGDAFASGGSVGYDHKLMGITARGAWESVKRHFRELGIDCQSTEFTCLGIGDMAGDVFGNGMLLSKHIRLQAAFNHMHIFIDPAPEAASSFVERERLFTTPGCQWKDYDQKLISKGGGIFERSAKSITLTPEIKALLATQKKKMSPNELIHGLLKMKVDLLWNGGIGTYVKSSKESHLDVGDRANDVIRINGNELQAQVVGEGGNLGLTQLGRIEYALNDGRINTDSVDNAGGVDCSDNEVNIKILLKSLVDNGDLTVKQRNKLLYDMTEQISDIVIDDCIQQTCSLSVTEIRGVGQLKEQVRFINALEKSGKLNRSLELLPSEEEIAERFARGEGLTRPELSVLHAYSKMVLKEELACSDVADTPYYEQLLVEAFPIQIQKQYREQMQKHPLRTEIIATKLANKISNHMGVNFMDRMQGETGASVVEIAHCYTISSAVFELPQIWQDISLLDNKIKTKLQTELFFNMRRTVRRVVRWFLRYRDKSLSIEQTINFYKPTLSYLSTHLTELLVSEEVETVSSEEATLVNKGVPENIATRIAQLTSIYPAMDIADLSEKSDQKLDVIAKTFFELGASLDIHWFLNQINSQPVANHWQGLARASFREDLDCQQRVLTDVVLKSHASSTNIGHKNIIELWLKDNAEQVGRWLQTLSDFKVGQTHEFAKFSVVMRELMLLHLNSEHV